MPAVFVRPGTVPSMEQVLNKLLLITLFPRAKEPGSDETFTKGEKRPCGMKERFA